MSLETEQEFRRKSREAQERAVEAREAKEGEVNEELKAAAAMERADYLVKEVKSSKQQMQNIVLNMQQVQNAIRQLRAQLQLAEDSDDPESVKQDKKKIAELKKKIVEHADELEKMRGDLVHEQIEELKNGVGAGMATEDLRAKAEAMVEEMIQEIKD